MGPCLEKETEDKAEMMTRSSGHHYETRDVNYLVFEFGVASV